MAAGSKSWDQMEHGASVASAIRLHLRSTVCKFTIRRTESGVYIAYFCSFSHEFFEGSSGALGLVRQAGRAFHRLVRFSNKG